MRLRSPGLTFALAGLALGAVLVALLPASVLFRSDHRHAHADEATGERWACPMMDYIGNRPGNCPVCGMEMTKVTAGELTREQRRRMGVQLATVSEGPAVAVIRAYGTVRYDERTQQVVIPRVAGRVVKRHPVALHEGTFAQAGDPVVDLYSPEVFAAQGELAAAVRLGDRRTVDALAARFERWNLRDVAEGIINGNEPTDTITIRTPFAGRVVVAVDGGVDSADVQLPQVGQEVQADTVLLRLVDPDAYMLIVQVPEARAHWVRVGQPVQLASDVLGELPELGASIAWVSPVMNTEIRTREVHVHLKDAGRRLLPGDLVNARIQAALTTDLAAVDPGKPESAGRFALIPKTAVLSTGVRNVAWRVAERQEDGSLRFELAPLALGPRIEDEGGNDVYIVRAGLAVGDEVATQGAFLIDSQAQLAGTPSLLYPQGALAPAVVHQH